MGYSGNKIPGHSGTAQKNRKFFSQKKFANKSSDGIARVQFSNAFYKQEKSFETISNLIMAFIILFIISVTYFSASHFNKGIIGQHKEHKKLEIKSLMELKYSESREKRNALMVLKKSAYNYLHANKLEEAQSEFTLALYIFPNNKEVILGMTKTLELQCQQLKMNCDYATSYLNAVKRNKMQEDYSNLDY